MKDLYEFLGVGRAATADEIKKAYRRLARKHHPDVNPHNANAEKLFREIQEAYAVLSNKEKRARYDEFGTVDEADAARRQGARHQRGAHQVQFDFGGFPGGFQDLGSIFGDIFGGARREEARPSAPAEAAVELDFAQAVRGSAVVVAVRREVACTGCSGSGRVAGRVCGRCSGSGVLVETERVRVKIPPGVGDGDRIRAGLKGGGEVSVAVQVRPDPFFERRGDDIYTTVPVSFPEAYGGADVEVGTIWGPVRAKVPPGTSSGQRFRLRGKGVRNIRTGVNGDHFYTVLVAVPRVVTPAGRDSMRRVTELYGPGYDPRSGMPLSLDGR